MSRCRRMSLLALGLVAAAALAAGEAARAWTPSTTVAMAEWALPLMPPDLERQIVRLQREFRDGVAAGRPQEPLADSELRASIMRQSDRAVEAIVEHRPFSEIVFRMGVVAARVAAANRPIRSPAATGSTPAYRDDYFRYVEGASRRFAVLYYDHERRIGTPRELETLVGRAQARSRALDPLVAEEYERIGAINGVELFDDRSTAFGVGALAFSHGVSDIVGVLRYIWLRAGGTDDRGLPQMEADQLILVGHGRYGQ